MRRGSFLGALLAASTCSLDVGSTYRIQLRMIILEGQLTRRGPIAPITFYRITPSQLLKDPNQFRIVSENE
jgi:hypothetical protein